IRAATSMFLMSLANIFPRRASMTAFLCLVVAHLEWPDLRWSLFLLVLVHDLGHLLDEEPVEPVVAGDLGVERRGEQVRLPDRDDPTHRVSRGHGGDDLYVVPDLLHPGRPDEQRVEGRVEAGDRELGLERVDLAPEGVAPHHD